MLSEKSENKNELLRLLKNAVDEYCIKYALPEIPIRYGRVKETSGLEFNIHHPSITISTRLSPKLGKHIPYNRVWYMLEAVGHELKHYDQYLRLRKKNIQPQKELFNEEEAYLAGYNHADDNIGKYNPDQINPILPEIGSGIVAGVGLGMGFKAVDILSRKLLKHNPSLYSSPSRALKNDLERLYRLNDKNYYLLKTAIKIEVRDRKAMKKARNFKELTLVELESCLRFANKLYR